MRYVKIYPVYLRGWRRLRLGWLPLAVALCLNASLPSRTQAPDHSRPIAIHSVLVDGAPATLQQDEKLRLSPGSRTIAFHFGPATSDKRQPTRFRFKLDGYEDNWREYDGSMRLCVRFLDAAGDQVDETVFKIAGQSPGWTGNPENSSFLSRREIIVVPPRATGFWVVMTSAGPPATVGVYAITNLVVKSQTAENAPFIIALPWAFANAPPATNPDAAPAGWMRDGLRPSMATVFETRSLPANRGFALVDDDVNGHAEWHTIKEMATPVAPGDRLVVEWSEAYSFGLAGRVEVSYPTLPAGYYRFRVNELSVSGVPGEAETSVAIEMPLAFWRTPWFWVSVATILLAAAAGLWRYAIWRQKRLQFQSLEQHLAVDRERLRIAQDIHDDLGARVTQISLLSAVAQSKTSLPEEARIEFGKVSQMTRELVSALYETVWAVNPENDNFDALASYLCQMSNQYCSQARLRCRLEIPEATPGIPLTSQVRHNLSMAVKEAIHNVVKHARATEVRLRISLEQASLNISIQDDGCGFDPDARGAGNGLGNMQRRLRDIGGTCNFESRLGAGTTVSLQMTLPKTARAG